MSVYYVSKIKAVFSYLFTKFLIYVTKNTLSCYHDTFQIYVLNISKKNVYQKNISNSRIFKLSNISNISRLQFLSLYDYKFINLRLIKPNFKTLESQISRLQNHNFKVLLSSDSTTTFNNLLLLSTRKHKFIKKNKAFIVLYTFQKFNSCCFIVKIVNKPFACRLPILRIYYISSLSSELIIVENKISEPAST